MVTNLTKKPGKKLLMLLGGLALALSLLFGGNAHVTAQADHFQVSPMVVADGGGNTSPPGGG